MKQGLHTGKMACVRDVKYEWKDILVVPFSDPKLNQGLGLLSRFLRGMISSLVLGCFFLFLSFAFLSEVQSESRIESSLAAKEAYLNRYSDIFLMVEGDVVKILSDDIDGTPHQRFIIITSTGQTLLISHNLKLAPRIPLEPELKLRIYGEYRWNPRGGLIHKTHGSQKKGDPHGWVEIIHTGECFP